MSGGGLTERDDECRCAVVVSSVAVAVTVKVARGAEVRVRLVLVAEVVALPLPVATGVDEVVALRPSVELIESVAFEAGGTSVAVARVVVRPGVDEEFLLMAGAEDCSTISAPAVGRLLPGSERLDGPSR